MRVYDSAAGSLLSTLATSPRRTGPFEPVRNTSCNCSTVVIGVPTCTVSDLLPSVTAPAGIDTPLACSTVVSEAGEIPWAPIFARSGVITTCLPRAPVTWVSRTPVIPFSSGTTVSFSLLSRSLSSVPPEAASTIAGMSSVPPAKTCGSTSSGNWDWIRLIEVVTWLTADSMSVPYSNRTTTLVTFSRDVEVTVSMPSMPLTASSIGLVTCSSTVSGEAPGRTALTNAAGSSIDGNNCCFKDGIAKRPKPLITIAIRATRPRLARLSRVRADMGAPPR